MRWSYHDGGRSACGYRYFTEDCTIRAICIVTGKDYREVQRRMKKISPRSPHGCNGYATYLRNAGWEFFPVEEFFEWGELPPGRVIVSIKKHVAAVVDGTLLDTFDSSAHGTTEIEGFWTRPSSVESADLNRAFILF